LTQRILLLTPRFYGIERKITEALFKLNYEVCWIENKTFMMDFHSVESKLKLLRQIYFFFFSPRINYIRRELNKLVNIHFDILLSINANVACKYLFRKLRRENPDLLSILYLWDSTLHYSWIKEFKYFNRIITFDKADSEKYKIEYKPNF